MERAMDKTTVLFRKRLIPEECVRLDDDVILRCDDNMIVTSWKALHPKHGLSHGYSIYYLKRGIKVSRFISHDEKLMYWYCDIVSYKYNDDENSLLVTDMLADVLIYPDGRLKVVDLDELAEAFDRHLIDDEALKNSLLDLNRLLEIIYSRQFSSLERPILDLLPASDQ